MTKLGRLVKAGKIKSMEEIYLHSLPIKEYQIVDFFLPKLKDEVMKVRYTRSYFVCLEGGFEERCLAKAVGWGALRRREKEHYIRGKRGRREIKYSWRDDDG